MILTYHSPPIHNQKLPELFLNPLQHRSAFGIYTGLVVTKKFSALFCSPFFLHERCFKRFLQLCDNAGICADHILFLAVIPDNVVELRAEPGVLAPDILEIVPFVGMYGAEITIPGDQLPRVPAIEQDIAVDTK